MSTAGKSLISPSTAEAVRPAGAFSRAATHYNDNPTLSPVPAQRLSIPVRAEQRPALPGQRGVPLTRGVNRRGAVPVPASVARRVPVELEVVIPAYNESARLPTTLRRTAE